MTAVPSAAIAGGFDDPARDSQAAFRAILAALAEPGTVQILPDRGEPPAPLPRGLGVVALTVCDADTPVWFAPAFATAADWLTFHNGALSGPREGAAFAFDAEVSLDGLALGTDANPHTSATLVAPVALSGTRFTLSGPGLAAPRTVALDLPPAFADRWAANRAHFPRGVDALLCDGLALIGLPRTTEVTCTLR